MSDTRTSDSVQFEGEEAGSGYAAPVLDLIATAFLVLVSVTVMVASLSLPVPGDIETAPGLLPFLVAASLLIMALALGASALARHRSGIRIPAFADRDIATDVRSIGLIFAIALYIAGLQFLAFRQDLVVGGFRHTISAFEPVTTVALAVIIGASWRGPLWITVAVSTGWTLVLALVFQHVFKIPLPGSF